MQSIKPGVRVASCLLACAVTTLTLGQGQPPPAATKQAPASSQQAASAPPQQAASAPPQQAASPPPQQAASPPYHGKTLAASAGILAYPNRGQTPEQQTIDEATCYNWSKQQSGFDPMAAAAPAAQPQAAQAKQPPVDHTAVVQGTARGAAAGAAIGAIAGNAGKGAAIGATTGLIAKGRQSRMAQSQQKEQSAQQASTAQAGQQQLADTFKRGMMACLESRGYTVK